MAKEEYSFERQVIIDRFEKIEERLDRLECDHVRLRYNEWNHDSLGVVYDIICADCGKCIKEMITKQERYLYEKNILEIRLSEVEDILN